METITGIVAIVAMVILIVLIIGCMFIPIITKEYDKRKIQQFYDSINIGDGFEDPFYSNDPFSANHRVLEVIAKQDNYILYEINWYDSKTNLKCKNYTPRRDSTTVDRFYSLVNDYKKVKIFN